MLKEPKRIIAEEPAAQEYPSRKTLFSKTTMSGGKPYFIKKGKEKLYFSILSLLS